MKKNKEPKRYYKHTRTHKHRYWIGGILIFGSLVTMMIIFGIKNWNTAQKAMKTTYQATGMVKNRNVNKVIKSDKPFSILLLGTDTGALGRNKSSFTARTDTMIVATMNPKTSTISLTSIPRDTLITINGQTQKINAAYTIDGAKGAVKAVQKLLKVPIDFYALLNMGGLKQIVNAMGGVQITPTLTFKYGQANVKKGHKITLNGAAALDYARMRYDDPLGDYGRQKRQKQIIMSIVQQASSFGSILHLQQIIKKVSHNMRTDLTFNDMISIYLKYHNTTHHMKTYTLTGTNATVDGLSYQIATAKARYDATMKIRKQLGLSTKRVTKTDFSATPAISSQK